MAMTCFNLLIKYKVKTEIMQPQAKAAFPVLLTSS